MPRHASLAHTDFAADPAIGTAESRGPGVSAAAPEAVESPRKDYFVERDGLVFAGSHLLADFWGASGLDDAGLIEAALREAVAACGASLLHIHLHQFTENGGISGVAVLAESHISVHSWPERGFAAFDVFMCGACDPYAAIPVLRRHFAPETFQLTDYKRGIVG